MTRFVSNGVNHLAGAEARVALAFDRYLEDRFVAWGATPVIPAGMMSRETLERIDYFRNFPHLVTGTYAFDEQAQQSLAAGTASAGDALPNGWGSEFLPSATCYSIFDHLADSMLPSEALFTALGRCFRNESQYIDSNRKRSFLMREVVYLGTSEGAYEFGASAEVLLAEFGSRMGLALSKSAANDPFYAESSRSVMTKLDPVKFEFLTTDGMALASLNRHRNFFGDRLSITYGHDQPVTSSCLAFGIDRWVSALVSQWGREQAFSLVKQLLKEDAVGPGEA